jgi:AraC family transcriptional regulator of adaptative response/methylated-DNA-[protein]-cysteine methyltransferase
MITTEAAALPDRATLEAAFYASDPRWDGRFVAAVRTTGIYCRPSCRVRKPLAKNVSFLPDAAARAAGYRACLRCHPDQTSQVALRTIETPIGPMLAGASPTAVVLLDFAHRAMIGAQLAAVRRRIGSTREADSPLLDRLEQQLAEYFAASRREFDLPLDVPGSQFQEHIWGELKRIPYGGTISYRELAERVGTPNAFRAVGRANGSNRVAIVIPCHRVIAADGRLGGYGGGLPAKEWLLELERRSADGFKRPK